MDQPPRIFVIDPLPAASTKAGGSKSIKRLSKCFEGYLESQGKGCMLRTVVNNPRGFEPRQSEPPIHRANSRRNQGNPIANCGRQNRIERRSVSKACFLTRVPNRTGPTACVVMNHAGRLSIHLVTKWIAYRRGCFGNCACRSSKHESCPSVPGTTPRDGHGSRGGAEVRGPVCAKPCRQFGKKFRTWLRRYSCGAGCARCQSAGGMNLTWCSRTIRPMGRRKANGRRSMDQ